jgi:RNA 2',3'-cyclic 3'-phosphodiesterase
VQNRQIRSFIAIELPSNIKAKLDELQKELKQSKLKQVKWASPSGIHLTLKFLGNIDAGDTEKITAAIKESCSGYKKFALELSELGVFPNYRRPRVIWLGVSGQIDILLKLQKQIDDKLGLIGFPREKRPFSPHITLGRVRDSITSYEQEQYGGVIQNNKYSERHIVTVASINLMKSQLQPAGAVYSEISSIKLE